MHTFPKCIYNKYSYHGIHDTALVLVYTSLGLTTHVISEDTRMFIPAATTCEYIYNVHDLVVCFYVVCIYMT